MRLHLTSFLLLTAMAAAQTTTVTAPNSAPGNVDRPFAGGVGRYQQWYNSWTLQGASGFSSPVRLNQLEFFAGSIQSSNATMLDMEVSIGHGKGFGITGVYASNFDDTPVIVLPRQNVQLAAGAPGAVVMTIPFGTTFTWDFTRPIVVDIKIFGNSRGNQPFQYNNRGTLSGFSATSRLYSTGNPSATNGQVQANVGLITRFTGRDGVVLYYGSGCAGEGFHVPDYEVVNLPWPGIVWNHRISNASSQRFCILMIGDNRTTFGSGPQTVPLPADVGTLLGFSPNGCFLRQNSVATIWGQTVGGGPGAGSTTVPISLPPLGFYIGTSLYTQFFVLDPNSPNGLMSATRAAWSIVAPVGG
ncbi:MAG: hypothetical protein NXI31_14050 [bacterium]|nr:hypothetical protein [bacterium]